MLTIINRRTIKTICSKEMKELPSVGNLSSRVLVPNHMPHCDQLNSNFAIATSKLRRSPYGIYNSS